MAEEVSIARLRREQEARRVGLMARVQSVLIFFLLVEIAEDHDHNQYLQDWTATHLAGIGFLLNGTLAAFYAGMLAPILLKGPQADRVSGMIRRKELVVPESVVRFYDEIASQNSEPRNKDV